MAPSISKRAFIEWEHESQSPSEPTSTLVLTSSKRRFVDIRILISPEGIQRILPSWRLDWAFAGVSELQTRNGVPRSTWHHWIDSKTQEPEIVVDEGDILPENEDGLALEKGCMVYPPTGRMTNYVEGWKGVEPLATSRNTGTNLRNFGAQTNRYANGGHASHSRICAVLVANDEQRKARGMVLRLGQFVQGIIRVGEQVALERWEWAAESGWVRETRIGDLPLPCPALLQPGEGIGEGFTVITDGLLWHCVELEDF